MNKRLKPRATAALLMVMAQLAWGAAETNDIVKYTVGDWPVIGLGNVRARVFVAHAADAVWSHIPWRRHDSQPESKDVIVIDAATGRRVTNVVRARISREAGDVLFEPITAPGEYYIYYLPFRTEGSDYFPTTLYLPPSNTAEAGWASKCATAVAQIKEGKLPQIPPARLMEIQAINDFHRFDPMEITATAAETSHFMAQYGDHPYLLFPEDRRQPIRLKDELPLRWVEAGPRDSFTGEACRGEFYCFQVGFYACRQKIEKISISFEDLTGSNGAVIPANAIRCFNLGGTNWLGQGFHKDVDVPQGQVQPSWIGVMVPKDAPAGKFRGKIRFRAKNAPATSVAVELDVSNTVLADAGDDDIWRQSRLRWLDSTIGLDDDVFAPYSPVARRGRVISVLGRTLSFNECGLPDSISSSFSRNVDSTEAPDRQILSGPIDFVAETPAEKLRWKPVNSKILRESSGAVSWQTTSDSGPLRLECNAKMECDGYINFKLTVRAAQTIELKDLRLEIPLHPEMAVYMMGMGREGGYRPASWNWKWDLSFANNQLWIGDVNAGLSMKLKDIDDHWDLYNLKESGLYRDWSNGGRGGCTMGEEKGRVMIRAYSGPRSVKQNEELHFNFGLLITPVKTLDKAHWSWRYFPEGSSRSLSDIAAAGATIINIHQGDALNPYINYPFLTTDGLSAFTRSAHARNMKVKLYYTVRELSDYTGEFWPLRSLGNEVFRDGPGFELADQFAQHQPGQDMPKTGDSWLCEHVVSGYVPAWHTPLGNGRIDAAVATSGLSRWHNYYLEGLAWLIRHTGIDGLYLDGVGYDREIMKRVRKVMQREGRGGLMDFHSGNNFHPEYGLNNVANQYMELFPCIDSLWIGEGFDYNKPPDYWMVEIAGLPYGLFGEMLQGGGNPWRGMLFGMTGRLGYSANPQSIWKLWDDFGVQEANMRGFWDPACPVKTGLKDVLATAYVKSGKTLVSVASWATNRINLHMQIDCASMGLAAAKTKLYAPAIPNFQSEAEFQLGDAIPVEPGKGWLLILRQTNNN